MQTPTFILALFILLFSPVLLIVAVIAPNWVNKHLKREFSRKEYIRNLLIATLVAFAIALYAAPASTTTPSQSASQVASPNPETVITEETSSPQESLTPVNQEVEVAMSPSPTPSPSSIPTVTPTPSPTIKPTSVTTPKSTTISTPTPTSVPKVTTGGGWTCSCGKTCSQMSSCAEAQYQLNTCGCGARDADNDGIACDADCQ